jgi:hypothetical protein
MAAGLAVESWKSNDRFPSSPANDDYGDEMFADDCQRVPVSSFIQMERPGFANPPCVPRARIEVCTQSIRKFRWTAMPLFIEG